MKTPVGDPYCLVCGGTGFRGRDRRLDKPDENQTARADSTTRTHLGRTRAGAARVLLELRKIGAERKPDDRELFERRRKRLRYARRAMDALRIANEPAWQTVTAAYVEQRYPLEDGEPVLAATPGLRALFGLSFVERRMPVPFRLPAGLQQQLDMLERERKVRSALRAGKSKRRIAREQGVSMRKINRAVA